MSTALQPLAPAGYSVPDRLTADFSAQASTAALYLKIVLRQRNNPNPVDLAATPGLCATARNLQEVLAQAAFYLTTPIADLPLSELLTAKAWSKLAAQLPTLPYLGQHLDAALVSGAPAAAIRSVVTDLESLASLLANKSDPQFETR